MAPVEEMTCGKYWKQTPCDAHKHEVNNPSSSALTTCTSQSCPKVCCIEDKVCHENFCVSVFCLVAH
jgi:hypothetical protein